MTLRETFPVFNLSKWKIIRYAEAPLVQGNKTANGPVATVQANVEKQLSTASIALDSEDVLKV